MNHLKKRLFKGVLLIGMLFVLQSCFEPANKDAYLEKFENFVETVEKERTQYTADDWEQADERFDKFTGKWYRKFKGEYTLKDQLKIKGLTFAYNLLREDENSDSVLNDLFREDLDNFKKQLDDYVENDAQSDLEDLKKEAGKLGESAKQMLDETLREIQEK